MYLKIDMWLEYTMMFCNQGISLSLRRLTIKEVKLATLLSLSVPNIIIAM